MVFLVVTILAFFELEAIGRIIVLHFPVRERRLGFFAGIGVLSVPSLVADDGYLELSSLTFVFRCIALVALYGV